MAATPGITPTEVVFFCPGTTEKPLHPCTQEAIASIEYALEAPVDKIVIASLDEATPAPAATPPEPVPAPYQPIVDKIQAKIGNHRLRVQVKCRHCGSVSILTDAHIKTPHVQGTVGSIYLMPPTPGDEALIDAAKGISGAEALKNSMANGVFVTANIALLTTFVTALGLAKTEEIGTKITQGGAGVFLLLAVALVVIAIAAALWAMLVRVREIQLGNLEAVRASLKAEVSERATASGISLFTFGLAIVAIGIAFAWVTIENLRKKDSPPQGSLSVSVSPASLDVAIETKWTEAEKGAELQLAVTGAASLDSKVDTKDGVAEIKTSVRATRDAAGPADLDVTSKLVKDGGDVPGAVKRQCYVLPPAGAIRTRDCP